MSFEVSAIQGESVYILVNETRAKPEELSIRGCNVRWSLEVTVQAEII